MKRRDRTAYEEAVTEAHRWHAQARRLYNALQRQKLEHDAEMIRLRRDREVLMEWNAGLSVEIAEVRHENAKLKGEV